MNDSPGSSGVGHLNSNCDVGRVGVHGPGNFNRIGGVIGYDFGHIDARGQP